MNINESYLSMKTVGPRKRNGSGMRSRKSEKNICAPGLGFRVKWNRIREQGRTSVNLQALAEVKAHTHSRLEDGGVGLTSGKTF